MAKRSRNPSVRELRQAAEEALARKDVKSAFAAFTSWTELAPRAAEPWYGRGSILLARGEYAAAGAQFERATELDPAYAAAWHELAQTHFAFGEVDLAMTELQTAIDHADAKVSKLSAAIFAPGAASVSPAEVRRVRERFADALSPVGLPGPARQATQGPSTRPIRVGYLSAHFDRVNYMKPVWGMARHHDRERFEWHFFSDAEGEPEAAGYQRDPRDTWHDLRSRDTRAAAELILAQELDVLIDLNAYSYSRRLPLWKQRLARVTAAWFNMFATSGLPGFDVLIGDSVVYRDGEAELFSERVISLPCCYLTFAVPYAVPDVVSPPVSRNGYVTLGCLAPQYKITDSVLAAWKAMLERVPTARLLLRNRIAAKEHDRLYVEQRFREAGLPWERVELLPPAPHAEFLATYDRVDIVLDTFPYNGGTTTMEALWQGLPVCCIEGDRWCDRISASLVRHAAIPELAGCVTASIDEHVEQVVKLATTPGVSDWLASLRSGMRDRLATSPILDGARLASELEAVYADLALHPPE